MKTRKELKQWALDKFIEKFNWEEHYEASRDWDGDLQETIDQPN